MIRGGAILVLVFISLLGQAVDAGTLLDRVVAVVNKQVITWSDLYGAMELETRLQGGFVSKDSMRKTFAENERAFLDNMIEMKLELQEAERQGLAASEEEVGAALAEMRNRLSLDEEGFVNELKKEGLTVEDYKGYLRDQILLEKAIDRNIRSKLAPPEGAVTGRTEVVGYKIRQIFFKLPASGDYAGIEEKARTVLERLRSGEDFSVLAEQYSEDASAKNGGELGLVRKSQIAPEFARAIEGLKRGDTSETFRTPAGLHIIKLDEVVESMFSEAELGNMEKRFKEEYKEWVRGLREKSYIEIKL